MREEDRRKTGERNKTKGKKSVKTDSASQAFFAYSLAITWDKIQCWYTLISPWQSTGKVRERGFWQAVGKKHERERRSGQRLNIRQRHKSVQLLRSVELAQKIILKLSRNLLEYEQHNYFMIEHVNHSRHPNMKPKPHKDNPVSINQLFRWNESEYQVSNIHVRGQTDQKSTDTSQQHVFQSEFVDGKKV